MATPSHASTVRYPFALSPLYLQSLGEPHKDSGALYAGVLVVGGAEDVDVPVIPASVLLDLLW